ncbi:MAG: glycosyltransferase [Rhizobiales bacterium]|nr:glycosyltransferase [Hyphomicrobiales bacterium]
MKRGHTPPDRALGAEAASDVLSVSIVVCTDGRPKALAATLQSLLGLVGAAFEVVVVRGPSEDGIAEVLEQWRGRIKVARNDRRNLSASRNLGIAAASGDIIAFLDDDAIPEPEWLVELAAAYRDPKVGGAGGFVYNPDGVSFQYRFGTVNRLGRANLDWRRAAPELSFPYSENFPHPLGANSSYRRAALLEIGGFDEEFDYYLDETDVTVRIIDAGWRMAQVEGAYVHHKYMPSALRNQERVICSWYSILKNHLYFGLLNGRSHHSFNGIVEDFRAFIATLSHGADWAVGAGKLAEADRTRFWQEVDAAWLEGMRRGISGDRRLPAHAFWQGKSEPFLPFVRPRPKGGRKCFCFLSQTYPPGPVGGIARYTHVLARAVADAGHQVHVLTASSTHDHIDFEEGVWVHRLAPSRDDIQKGTGPGVPAHIAAYSGRMRREVLSIAQKRPVEVVFAPIWDCEGLALLDDFGIPLVTNLVTPLLSWLKDHPKMVDAAFVAPMLAQEKRLMVEPAGILASSKAIVDEIEADYGIGIDRDRLGFVPYGLDDWTALPFVEPDPVPEGALRLLFVGRLEARKGIDVLLAAAMQVLCSHPNVHLDLVGDDRIPAPDGRTYREAFLAEPAAQPIVPRVHFHGPVNEEQLRGFYRSCTILVTPSRFESFGLMLVEAMMFAKPVIGCRAGGMPEVVGDRIAGLLAEPGDVDSLVACIEELIDDPSLRADLGKAARDRYETSFSATRMAEEIVQFFARTARAEAEVRS